MLRTISFPCIALLLIFSILAPSIMPLLSQKHDIVVLADTNEEEKNHEKESEKKFDEKDLFLPKYVSPHFILLQNKNLNHIGYTFPASNFNADIVVPPPRNFS
ncbi:hypothetical protein KIM67_13025 [Flagellimonas sp. 389]|uniref:hypothetical protein n=1 Tax=Flagellimonas sp. 389 TaxID=2835862 RepID=UPI001BD3C4C4|nr:hypothetical protein [Flagellimonas sp. 389]MBS9463334.1 hypothetical protein [Flagellimonas sp. 389]